MSKILSTVEEVLLGQVDSSKLMEYTTNISKEVRLSGSEEELRAFEYTQGLLDGFGLETKLYFRDAYISWPISGALMVGDEYIPCITHSMGVSVDNLSAALADVGSGMLDMYSKLDVQGKVVLVNGLANPQSVKEATEAGAIGAVFVNGRYTNEMITTPVWGMPTRESATNRSTLPVVSVNAEAGKRIREKMQQDSISICRMTAVVDTKIRPIPTLIAELRGTAEPDKFILFSGHIDSWHYGAMDNGTANAVMLEVARILSQHPQLLQRSLRFAFWSGHSHGRYAGSTWYADEHWEDLRENCYLHINIDSVGAKGASVLTQSHCMEETKALAAQVIEALTGEVYAGKRMTRMGDQSFWGTGTPSLFVSVSQQPEGGLGWWWHTTEDTMDKIDPDNLTRDCKIYLLILYRVLVSPVVPIDLIAGVEDVLQALTEMQDAVGEPLDLSECINRARDLREKLGCLFDNDSHYGSEEACAALNQCVLDVTSYLIPLNFVAGSQFDHDPALNQPQIPKLADVSLLAAVDPTCEDYHFVRAGLIRRTNELNWTLKCAIRSVEVTTQHISTFTGDQVEV
ncbi:peptidase M28 [Alicyclobacillus acidoterrestris]|nr:peptidase M28 [Alicyclobacillus acidoterrestris]